MDKKELSGAVARILLWAVAGGLTAVGASDVVTGSVMDYLSTGGADMLAAGIITAIGTAGWWFKAKLTKGKT